MADWVFVSPHLDDVVLSCGGAVAKAARTGSPLIVTVFAGLPVDGVSDFARFQHERWELDDTNAVEMRRCEDQRAAEALGSSVRVQWMDFQDAIYRDPEYSSDETLFGLPLRSDADLVELVHKELHRVNANRYVMPLGVGNHVDHQVVQRAGERLLREGAEIWGYAEVPYALDDALISLALLDGRLHDPILLRLDDDALERKCAAVSCYASQLPVLFRERGEPCEEIRAFALRQGSGEPAERVWRLQHRDPMLKRRPFVA